MKKFSTMQKAAWVYAAGFLFVVIISHFPGLTDAEGKLLGLFAIDPIDDIFHLVSGLLAVAAAWVSTRWSTIYFKIIWIPYTLDAITGLFFGVEFLNFEVFTVGLGSPDFSISSILVNLPHVLISAVAIYIGFVWAKRLAEQKPAAA